MRLSILGSSGLQVSQLGLGTLTWGRDTDEFEAHDQLDALLSAGGNWVETSARYGDGAAEALLGQVLRNAGSDVVVACSTGDSQQPGSLGRKPLRAALEKSLDALGRDRVDLWLLQGPDALTPLEEVAQTLDLALATGLVSYVGLNNFPAWQVVAIRAAMQRPNALVGVSYEYSLLERNIESDLLPALTSLGVGLVTWSPLGRGVLSGKYRKSIPPDSRAASPHLGGFARARMSEQTRPIVEALVAAADGLGVTPAEVALAWVMKQRGVTAAITGARTVGQLQVALRAAELDLPHQVELALSEISEPQPLYPTARWHF